MNNDELYLLRNIFQCRKQELYDRAQEALDQHDLMKKLSETIALENKLFDLLREIS